MQAAVRDVVDPMVVMRRVVDQARVLSPRAAGAVVELAVGEELVYACASGGLAEHVGTRLRLVGSLSGEAISTGETLYCRDAAADDRVDAAACRRVGARSLLCVPLRRSEQPVGVLKVTAPGADAFTESDVATLGRLARFVSVAITAWEELFRSADELLGVSAAPGAGGGRGMGGGGAAADLAVDQDGLREFVTNVLQTRVARDPAAVERIQRVISLRALSTVCQPIAELETGRLAGVEALTRFPSGPARPPDVWFAEARRVGLGVPLELAAMTSALSVVDHLPGGAFLTVNVGPDAILARDVVALLSAAGSDRLVIELTEHVRIESYPAVQTVLAEMRGRGTRLAIDDTGSGFASLSHLVQLAPDLIKLDRLFTCGIDVDPVRRALALALLSFARDTGAQVIAEGIETPGELAALRDLGVTYGQGYFIGRPDALDRIEPDYSHLVTDLVGGTAGAGR